MAFTRIMAILTPAITLQDHLKGKCTRKNHVIITALSRKKIFWKNMHNVVQKIYILEQFRVVRDITSFSVWGVTIFGLVFRNIKSFAHLKLLSSGKEICTICRIVQYGAKYLHFRIVQSITSFSVWGVTIFGLVFNLEVTLQE